MIGRFTPGRASAVALFACAATVAALLGAGTAAADNEYQGQTYADAVEAIRQSGSTVKIGGKVGSFLPLPQCRVTGNRNASFLDSSGSNSGNVVMIHLNCEYPFALPGVPGASRASPEGRAAYEAAVEQAKQQQEEAQAAQQAEAEKAAAEAAAG